MTQDPYAPNNARLLSMQKWYRSIEQDGQICVGEGYPTIQLTIPEALGAEHSHAMVCTGIRSA